MILRTAFGIPKRYEKRRKSMSHPSPPLDALNRIVGDGVTLAQILRQRNTIMSFIMLEKGILLET
jgi:hypothetical protein